MQPGHLSLTVEGDPRGPFCGLEGKRDVRDRKVSGLVDHGPAGLFKAADLPREPCPRRGQAVGVEPLRDLLAEVPVRVRPVARRLPLW